MTCQNHRVCHQSLLRVVGNLPPGKNEHLLKQLYCLLTSYITLQLTVSFSNGFLGRRLKSTIVQQMRNLEFPGRRIAPRGHFVVYVGEKLRRFEVPLSCLSYPVFRQLMETAAEEFGFYSRSKIVLPCDEVTFSRVLAGRTGLFN